MSESPADSAALDQIAKAANDATALIHACLTAIGMEGPMPGPDAVYERITQLAVQLSSMPESSMVHRYPLLLARRPEGLGVFLQVGVIPEMRFASTDDGEAEYERDEQS